MKNVINKEKENTSNKKPIKTVAKNSAKDTFRDSANPTDQLNKLMFNEMRELKNKYESMLNNSEKAIIINVYNNYDYMYIDRYNSLKPTTSIILEKKWGKIFYKKTYEFLDSTAEQGSIELKQNEKLETPDQII